MIAAADPVTEERIAPTPPSMPGARYQLVDNRDGTFDIPDVPVFAECHWDNQMGIQFEFTADWIAGAIAKAIQRKMNGHTPPLHYRHKSSKQVQPISTFALTHSRVADFGDGPKVTAFARLIRVPAHWARRIAAGELPYVSIEAHKPASGEIDALALMDYEVSFHKFPNLTIGKVVYADPVEAGKGARPAVGFMKATSGDGVAVLFEFSKENAMEPAEDKNKKPVENQETPPAAANGESAMVALVNQLMTKLDTFGGVLAAIAKELGVEAEEAPETDMAAEEPAEDDDKKDKNKGSESAKPRGRRSVEGVDATAAGIEAGMGTRLRKIEADLAAERRLRKAEASLSEYALSDKDRTRMEFFARQGDKPLMEFVALITEHGVKAPTGESESEDDTVIDSSNTPAAVMEFRAGGPDVIAAARQAHESYASLKARGLIRRVSEKQFIVDRLNEAGIPVPAGVEA